MPNRPAKKKKKITRKTFPAYIPFYDSKAEEFLESKNLLKFMRTQRLAHLEEVAKEEITVFSSIGTTIYVAGKAYIAHVYCVDNCEDERKNGWIVHLWHVHSVINRGSKNYRKYAKDIRESIGVNVQNKSL